MHNGNIWDFGAKGTRRLPDPHFTIHILPSLHPDPHIIGTLHTTLHQLKSFLFRWVVVGVTGAGSEYPLYTPVAYPAGALADRERVQ